MASSCFNIPFRAVNFSLCPSGCLATISSERVLEMGSAGDSPAPVRDPPTGSAERNDAKRPCPLARTVSPVPSGESPDGTGGSPVLPKNDFSNTLLGVSIEIDFCRPHACQAYVDPREPLRDEGPARCAGNPKLEIRNPNLRGHSVPRISFGIRTSDFPVASSTTSSL